MRTNNYLFDLTDKDFEVIKNEHDEFISMMLRIVDLYKTIKSGEKDGCETNIIELFIKAKNYLEHLVMDEKTQYESIMNHYEESSNDHFKIYKTEVVSTDGREIEPRFILIDYSEDDEIIRIPSNISTIERNCFYHKTSIKVVVVPETVKTISENAFVGCKNLEKIYVRRKFDNNILSGCDKAEIIVIE